jgi:hypothetical protein
MEKMIENNLSCFAIQKGFFSAVEELGQFVNGNVLRWTNVVGRIDGDQALDGCSKFN